MQACKEEAQPAVSPHPFLGVFRVGYTDVFAVDACG